MSHQDTMQAAIVESVDGPFVVKEIPRPVAGPGQVLVEIHASGVNPLDLKIHAGKAAHARQPLPAVLGIDLAGVVIAIGAGVPGSLAQYAAVDASLLAPKPPQLSMREAASLPLAFITAWEGLVDRAHVSMDMRVLVHGGAG